MSLTMVAKAYRLLCAVLMTTVKGDELIRINPRRMVGADQEKPVERSVLSVPQLVDLAERMPDRFRAFILVTAFGSLRWARRSHCDVDVSTGTSRARQAFVEHRSTGLILGPPKSKAGMRTHSAPERLLNPC